ncbi:TraB/GumN family protein [Xanthomonas sp. AM6]|uniref:TraB/GumN family protein n=1 Tax=Xanthomonas sp. AM6 TaxID=2982531 RepID=UPI0021D883A0|nr:TraB/GumN family protein [Xanthomonas sp. AM6]UYB54135.1 TraB/GumN family protein [Xanthomonas sp. AM6]
MSDGMNELSQADEALFAGQPYRIVERDGVRYTLLGTAHVSLTSVAAVERAIDSGRFDAVAVELDPQRLQALTDPDALTKLDLVQVIRKGRVALFAANLALAAYQRRLAEQLGIEPGAELKRAVLLARERQLPVYLIDREVGLTFKRASGRLGFFGKLKLGSGLLGGLFASDEVGEAEIEKLKQGDMLEASFGDFASESPALYDTIIAERDRYMATRLREEHAQRTLPSQTPIAAPDYLDAARAAGIREVLAVVGAGHLAGLARHLQDDQDDPASLRKALEDVPTKKKVPWITLTLTALVLGGVAWGYWRGGFALGTDLLLQWVLFTGGLAGLGCLLAGGHPLSIVAGAIAAPLKPFRPGVPAGAFSALVEVHMRKPAYGDFLALRDDAQNLRGWYRNRVSRVVLTFLLTNLGSMLGVWLAGFRIFGKLAG